MNTTNFKDSFSRKIESDIRKFSKDEQILKLIREQIASNYVKHIKDSDLQEYFVIAKQNVAEQRSQRIAVLQKELDLRQKELSTLQQPQNDGSDIISDPSLEAILTNCVKTDEVNQIEGVETIVTSPINY